MDELKEKIMSMGFARNVWAEKRLCKLCPGNNIQRFMECLQIEDTSKQFDVIQEIISIMHEAYELQMKYSNSDYEPFEVFYRLAAQTLVCTCEKFSSVVRRCEYGQSHLSLL